MELDMLTLTNKFVISHVCTRSEKTVATLFEGHNSWLQLLFCVANENFKKSFFVNVIK